MGFKKSKPLLGLGPSPQVIVGMITACLLMLAPGSAMALLFGKYFPVSLSGSLGYNYGYINSGGGESETTNLTGTINATGFIWQPWFATTSAALTLGLSKTDTSISSSDSRMTAGDLSLNIFPLSRFPFSLNYSKSDSRFQSYQDLTQLSGDSHYEIDRLTLRQVYEGKSTRRSIGSRTSLWYSTTDFNSDLSRSESEAMGADYYLRSSPHSLIISANQNKSKSSESSQKPATDILTVTHNYLPGPDMGVTNLATYVDSDNGLGTIENTITQVSSNFFWRPEHRLVHVNGGVRASDSRSKLNSTDLEQKSLNTNLAMTYQMTRHLSLGGGVALGSSDTGASQSLSTSQSGRLGYNSSQIDLAGFDYHWQSGLSASNSSTRVNTGTTETSHSIQTSNFTLGHRATKSWLSGSRSSLGLSLGQSGGVTSSSEQNEPSKNLNHSVGLSWNRRGHAGSIYGNVRYSDSRTSGSFDSVFQNLDASISQDWIINRLSGLQGSVSYSASKSQTTYGSSLAGTDQTTETRVVRANFFYHHDRPFGFYNMNFTSKLVGTKTIDELSPGTLWEWDNRFHYHLGLLDTALSLRIIESAGGAQTKSLYFQATRSF